MSYSGLVPKQRVRPIPGQIPPKLCYNEDVLTTGANPITNSMILEPVAKVGIVYQNSEKVCENVGSVHIPDRM